MDLHGTELVARKVVQMGRVRRKLGLSEATAHEFASNGIGDPETCEFAQHGVGGIPFDSLYS